MGLTRAQSTELAKRLTALTREVQENIKRTAPKGAEDKSLERAGTALDTGDEAVNSVQEEFDHVLHQRYLAELRQLEAAQARLDSDEIDQCAECGGEISAERLLAYPLAMRCIYCQERYEKTHPGSVTPKL